MCHRKKIVQSLKLNAVFITIRLSHNYFHHKMLQSRTVSQNNLKRKIGIELRDKTEIAFPPNFRASKKTAECQDVMINSTNKFSILKLCDKREGMADKNNFLQIIHVPYDPPSTQSSEGITGNNHCYSNCYLWLSLRCLENRKANILHTIK